MIDLHSHILPGLDDGAADIATALDMARMYEDQGVECVACTPHIRPGLFDNSVGCIRRAVVELQENIDAAGIRLHLEVGADNHIVPSFLNKLRRGHLIGLADTRYVLLEPPHHVSPPRFAPFVIDLVEAGVIPILTHPERLAWIAPKYQLLSSLVEKGMWMQVTSGSLTGEFGSAARYWGERLLLDGLVGIIATDAHDATRRFPNLLAGRRAAERLVGDVEATRLVDSRPRAILAEQTDRSGGSEMAVAFGH